MSLERIPPSKVKITLSSDWHPIVADAPRDGTPVLFLAREKTDPMGYYLVVLAWEVFGESTGVWKCNVDDCDFDDDELVAWVAIPNFSITKE